MSDKPTVIVLAGGRAKPEASSAGWPEWRALAPLAGRPVLEWVMDALWATDSVGCIVVVGDESLRPHIREAALVPPGTDMWGSVTAGLERAGDGRALLCSADVPLLTRSAISDVVERGLRLDADIVYSIVGREDAEAAFPGMKRTWVTLADGVFTGGNLTLVNAPALLANDGVIRAAIAARKKPIKIATLLGPRLLFRVVTRQATVLELEAAVSRILDARARTLRTPFAEVGADLDDPAETPLFEAAIARRQA